MLQYQLFFGRDIHGRAALTDREWRNFSDQVLTRQLPDGFTVFDADGQMMNPTTQQIFKERTKVVLVAVPDTAATAKAIAAVKDAYVTQFKQRSVGVIVHPTCAAF